MNTLEYHETILSKVSFNEELLNKELEKAIRNIHCGEEPALLEWCRKELGEKYEETALEMITTQNKRCSWKLK